MSEMEVSQPRDLFQKGLVLQTGVEQPQNLHKLGASSCKYNGSGSMLAVASADMTCKIYDTTSGALLTTLSGHTLGVNDCAWFDERFVVTVSDDKKTKMWDIETGKEVSSCFGHRTFVFCIDVHPETRLLYTGGYDGWVRAFHASSGTSVISFDAHASAVSALRVNPCDPSEFVSGGQDGVCRVWDAAVPSCCKRSLHCDSKPIVAGVIYSPNGEYIAVSTADSLVNLYPSRGPAPTAGAGALKRYSGHLNTSFCLQASFFSGLPQEQQQQQQQQQQQLLLHGSEDGRLCVWDVDTMEMVQGSSGSPHAHADAVLSVATNPNPELRQVATAGREGLVQLWSLAQ